MLLQHMITVLPQYKKDFNIAGKVTYICGDHLNYKRGQDMLESKVFKNKTKPSTQNAHTTTVRQG